jgi:alkylation response protein AidB-like acyl-CoA dehydrogenase
MYEFGFDVEEELVAGVAADFAARELRPRMREHEAQGVGAEVRGLFDEAGLSDALQISAVAQAKTLEALAWGDAGATLSLMSPTLCRAVAEALGAPGATQVFVVEELRDGPVDIGWLPGSPPDASLLVFDPEGRWRQGRADLQPSGGLGLQATGGAAGVMAAPDGEGDGAAVGRGDGARALAGLHLAAGAMLAGVARASLEYARDYIQERRSFGKRLADHQGLAFLFAEMVIQTEAARWAVYAAASLGGGTRASDAWRTAADAACFVTDNGVQLLGGHGYMRAHPVEKWMRDARALTLCFGGRDAAWT